MPSRVGVLVSRGVSVYRNGDGSLFFRSGNPRRRTPVHGNHLWVTTSNVLMRGRVPFVAATRDNNGEADSEGEEGEEEQLAVAIAMSLGEEADTGEHAVAVEGGDDLSRAIAASLEVMPAPSPSEETTAPSCIICLLEIEREQPTTALACGHTYHSACVQIWLRSHRSCPICRARV